MSLVRGAANRPSSRSCLTFVWWLLLIGVGFYFGVSASRYAMRGPTFARKILELPDPHALPVAPPTSVLPSTVSAPAGGVQTAGSTPAGAPAQPQGVSGQTGMVAPGNAALANGTLVGTMETQVKQYNALLREVQDAARAYSSASKVADQPGPSPVDLTAREESATQDFENKARAAQALYDTIAATPKFVSRYVEKEPCIVKEELPPGLPAMNAEKLRFIRAR